MVQSAQHFYGKVSHVVNGSQYFHQLCMRVALSAWLLHSALESRKLLVALLGPKFDQVCDTQILKKCQAVFSIPNNSSRLLGDTIILHCKKLFSTHFVNISSILYLCTKPRQRNGQGSLVEWIEHSSSDALLRI